MRSALLTAILCSTAMVPASTAADPAPHEVHGVLKRATQFFYQRIAVQGGYVYAVSGDHKLREGEGVVTESVIWVQPPGTPAVGEAFLEAHDATQDRLHLAAAQAAGRALVAGQLHSGGWIYHIDFDAEKRRKFNYRYDLDGNPLPNPVKPADRSLSIGWDEWKRRRYAGNQMTLDDDTTQSAVRFLTRLDAALQFQDEPIHDAALVGLKSLLGSQYPNGGWSANYDRFPELSPSPDSYPVIKASYPQSWPQTWPKDFTGCYVTNDNLMSDMIATLLRAWRTYEEPRYLEAAKRAGDFLLLAQLPAPQPAWAQQYDCRMQPVWSRAFEPPAISGRESQTIMQALLTLCRETGETKYLQPIPAAVAYLRKSQLPDSRLARFYELKTNRPLYFTRGQGGGHVMTYSDDRLASNYGFIVDNHLDEIEAEYQRLTTARKGEPAPKRADSTRSQQELTAQVERVIAAQDGRGAWIEQRRLRHHKIEPESGVIDSQTFIANVRLLCDYLNSTTK